MRLTEFLLARIAEDERVLDLAQRMSIDSPYSDLWNKSGHHVAMSARRLRAECEAKREVVDLHMGHRGECDRDYQYGHGPCPTLAYVAAIYADHPDYRDEWKP